MSWKLDAMGKGRDKQGREKKKPKKAKQPAAAVSPNVSFRHHSVVVNQPEPAPRPTETA
jgi:hypothetical protein